MMIIIAPAKKMNMDTYSMAFKDLPEFKEQKPLTGLATAFVNSNPIIIFMFF